MNFDYYFPIYVNLLSTNINEYSLLSGYPILRCFDTSRNNRRNLMNKTEIIKQLQKHIKCIRISDDTSLHINRKFSLYHIILK